MSESAAPAAIGEVRSAAQVLHDDVMCQSFIQGSSTLAYACVLIRRGQYELAGHVLRHLDGRKAGRYRDIVFYLQCQIDIEIGLFGPVKARLVQRLREQPADSVGLSLLQACIQAELKANPALAQVAHAVASPPSAASPAPIEPFDSDPEVEDFFKLSALSTPEPASAMIAQAQAAMPMAPTVEPAPVIAAPIASVEFVPPPVAPSVFEASPAPEIRSQRIPREGSASADVDMVTFQPVLQDPGMRAFTVWDSYSGDNRKEIREPSLEGIIFELPNLLPHALEHAVASLDAGRTVKTCFAFKSATVTTLHQGDLNCGLITGPLNQSLIAIVRTETLFAKRAAQLGQNKQGERDGSA